MKWKVSVGEASKSRIVRYGLRRRATVRLMNLALASDRPSQSVYQLVSHRLRALDGRGRDLRIGDGV